MKWWNNKALTRWLRIIHRDLGFLMVGICLVYGISGMLLNHMNGKDPAFRTEERKVQLPAALSQQELLLSWNDRKDLPGLKKVLPVDEHHQRLMLEGGIGVYNSATGDVDYELHTKRQWIYWINKLHYNRLKGWSVMGNVFAVSLIFFALSGLFMVKGKKGVGGRGKWYLIVGICIPLAYVLLA